MQEQFKQIVNGLHAIDGHIKNKDLIKYALKGFPTTTLWTSTVDAYIKGSINHKLDKFFNEMKLHE